MCFASDLRSHRLRLLQQLAHRFRQLCCLQGVLRSSFAKGKRVQADTLAQLGFKVVEHLTNALSPQASMITSLLERLQELVR